jgi:transcription termination factor NusA
MQNSRKNNDPGGRGLILTNLDRVPGIKVLSTLGIAYGYASIKELDGAKWLIDGEGKKRPWTDDPEHFDALFKEAELRLARSGKKMGSDAVIKVEGKLSRDLNGLPEMLLMGTGVILEGRSSGMRNEKKISPPSEEDQDGSGVSVQVDGEKIEWSSPQASTPTMDVLKKLKDRDRKETDLYEDDSRSILSIAQEIGIPLDRARLLMENGFDTLDGIAKAEIKELSSIEGINPTQARIIRNKARDIASEE